MVRSIARCHSEVGWPPPMALAPPLHSVLLLLVLPPLPSLELLSQTIPWDVVGTCFLLPPRWPGEVAMPPPWSLGAKGCLQVLQSVLSGAVVCLFCRSQKGMHRRYAAILFLASWVMVAKEGCQMRYSTCLGHRARSTAGIPRATCSMPSPGCCFGLLVCCCCFSTICCRTVYMKAMYWWRCPSRAWYALCLWA